MEQALLLECSKFVRLMLEGTWTEFRYLFHCRLFRLRPGMLSDSIGWARALCPQRRTLCDDWKQLILPHLAEELLGQGPAQPRVQYKGELQPSLAGSLKRETRKLRR